MFSFLLWPPPLVDLIKLRSALHVRCVRGSDLGTLQVVPVKLRASAYAFDACISGAFGAAAAPLVGLIAAADGFSQRVAQVLTHHLLLSTPVGMVYVSA